MKLFPLCLLFLLWGTVLRAQPSPLVTAPPVTPMDITSILYNLNVIKALLDPVKKIAEEEYDKELTGTIYQARQFIQIRLYELPDSGSSYQQLYAQVNFSVDQNKIILFDHVRCENVHTADEIKRYIITHYSRDRFAWNTETPADQSGYYYSNRSEALLSADLIAKESYLCDQNYSPGYYSEIYIRENEIELQQVNHQHSRSIDHKDNYYLREVTFIIPLTEKVPDEARFEYVTGNLYIDFRDNSSPQNKECGNRMEEKIKELSKK